MSNLREKIQGSITEEDKAALKGGAKSCWTNFINFADKFTELIFCKLNSLVSNVSIFHWLRFKF